MSGKKKEGERVRETIINELRKIEETERVKILLAVESGSRAWGFASDDSDYDVRFIYVREKEAYLKLEQSRDVIEWKLDDMLDINGWDLKKALQLLYKSNPTVFEWCASPVVYLEREEFSAFRKLLPQYFSAKRSLFHYCHMAESNDKKYLKGEQVRLKKYLYVLRPLLAAKWISDRRTPPPMLFDALAEAELEESLKPEVEKLLKQKKAASELGVVPRIQIFHAYIDTMLPKMKEIAEGFSEEKPNWNFLNDTFLKLIS